MKKPGFIGLLIIAALTMAFGQQATTPAPDRLIQFSGFALTADSLMGVPFTHVTIINRGRVATAGPDGFFSFAAHEGDTLYFTSIGYAPSMYIIPAKLQTDKISVIQMMTPDVVWGPKTIIYPFNRENFHEIFMSYRPPDDDLKRAQRNMDRERLAELGEKLEQDGGEATSIALRNTSARTYYYGQTPPQNIFNPLAWAEFIRAWKRGDFKKKENSKSGLEDEK